MTAQAEQIPFTLEECDAMVKRKPVMASLLEMGKQMGIVKIVEQMERNHG
jgi:hypothetical protein